MTKTKVKEWVAIRRREHLKAFLRVLRNHGIFAPSEPEELAVDTISLLASDLALAHARIDLLEQAMQGLVARGRKADQTETVAPPILN